MVFAFIPSFHLLQGQLVDDETRAAIKGQAGWGRIGGLGRWHCLAE